MKDFVSNLLKYLSGEWTQTQKEALVDLCLLGIYSDSVISVAEQDFIQNESRRLKWESKISFNGYLQRVIPKVRQIQNDSQEKKELLQEIAERLGNNDARRKAIAALEKLLSTDGIAKIEEEFLREVKAVMRI